MQIKVCGMRDVSNIKAVIDLNVNYIGFVFHPASPRFVRNTDNDYSFLSDKKQSLHNIKTVGVFVNEMPQRVIDNIRDFYLDCIQLHGEEDAAYIEKIRETTLQCLNRDITVIKALSIKEADDVKRWQKYKRYADLLLFDTKCKGRGGSGIQFDWSLLDEYDGDIPFLLSGGIGPVDVPQIKKFKHPMFKGVDVNSKFEISPTIKDVDRLKTFINDINNY
ncbi:MAG: phosphoribosylanthranilate isomerase [Prevotellaceae bacterium]|nr:phosphoribosylanthranilate isomerase [Prevotellaceae bacterium]